MVRWILVCVFIVSTHVLSAEPTSGNEPDKGADVQITNAASHQADVLTKVQPDVQSQPEFTAFNLIALCFLVYLIWTAARYIYMRKREANKAQADKLKWQVYHSLTTSLDAKHYTILTRHLYPEQLEALSLDCVVLSPFGIFVVVVVEQSGLIAVETDSQVWPCRHKNKTHYLANPLTAAAQRASTLAGVLNTPFGVRWLAVFPDDAEFSPTRPTDCCKVSEVSLDILRYTRCQFSHEQVSLFEQAVLSYGQGHKRLSA
ncbi:nuclease-related domain-containing protein [Pseudoalteromonas rubra]|uniref:nuclease-related domain-containing protein n=1 Tax=Pseudoalteromonas rubra TaxID=43658 RepID=UPI002DBDDA79|nr:nuclease-related domain-containing protein [Pseudoalteromonas rubra]MEC4088910.1 nuclease-related domain-containing protein [Pseudoalteromonas rubra]